MRLICCSAAVLIAGPFLTSIGFAQDRRQVFEPVIPSVCTTLTASLKTDSHGLAEADEDKLDTVRLQQALDHCAKGKAVELAVNGESHAFLAGPFSIPESMTLLIDRGVTLYASRDPRLYDLHSGSCGVVNQEGQGCKTLISVKNAPHAAIMGEGSIDGRGGANILHGKVSWWSLAAEARAGGRQQVPRMMEVTNSDDFTLYKITLRNSANFHVVYRGGKGFTAWGVKIDTPRSARNTDGIDPSGSSDITVTKSFIRTGDDNIAIKGSAGGVTHMSVLDNHFYYGHGMSIGSETYDGVSDLFVSGLSLDGTDSGIRIKSNSSRGGLVDRVTYTNICIRESKNPLFIETSYNNPGERTDRYPQYNNIVLKNVEIFGGGKIFVGATDEKRRTTIRLDGVMLDDPKRYTISAEHVIFTYGPGPVNFAVTGADVSFLGKPGNGTLPGCANRFVAFPSQPQ